MFQQLSDGDDGRAERLAAVSCLLATALVSTCLAAAWGHPVSGYALAVAAASSTVLPAFGAAALTGRLISGDWKTPLFCAAAGVWFTPVLLAAWEGYAWSILLAGCFAAFLARGFTRYAAAEDEEKPWRLRSSSLAGAACLHLTVAAVFAGSGVFACVSAAAGCFLIAWTARPKPKPQRAFGLSVAFRLSIAVAACTLLWMPHRDSGSTRAPDAAARPPEDDTHSGVILLAETRPRKTIRAPRPRNAAAPSRLAPVQIGKIPFTGEYWFYHHPLRRPPKNSLIETGSPLTFVLTNVDRHALSMVASQPMPREFETGCCSAVEVSLRNADREPNDVGIEVLLYAPEMPDAKSMRRRASLGTQRLGVRAEDTLRFPFPPVLPIETFDEIRVLFHLTGQRRYRSANVAIEGFSLIPR